MAWKNHGYKHLAVLLVAGIVGASNADWRQAVGPTGGYVEELTSDGTALIASVSYAGLHRSFDNGQSWERLETTLPFNIQVEQFGSVNGEIFMMTRYNGIYRTSDSGDTWTPANAGLENTGGMDMHVDGNTVYLVAGQSFGSPGNLHRWDAMSASWNHIPTPFDVAAIYAEDDLLVISAGYVGFARSTDGGETWDTSFDTIALIIAGDFVRVGNAILTASNQGVFRSLDDGETWDEILLTGGNALVKYNGAVYLADSYDGVQRSWNAGDTWEVVDSGLPYFYGGRTETLTAHNGNLFVGLSGGVAKLNDSETAWETKNDGIIGMTMSELVQAGDTLFARHEIGWLCRSDDNGHTWSKVTLPTEGTVFTVFAYDDDTIFVGTRGGVVRSLDGGDTWQLAVNGWPQYDGISGMVYYDALSFARAGDYLLVGTGGGTMQGTPTTRGGGGGGGPTYISAGAGVLRSSNKGASWQIVRAGLPASGIAWNGTVQYQPVREIGVFYDLWLASTGSAGVYRSQNQGASWQSSNGGLPTYNDRYPQMSSFVLVGSDILASSSSTFEYWPHAAVLRSSNGGVSWVPSNAGLPDDERATDLIRDGDRLLVAINSFVYGRTPGLYESVDAGASWQQVADDPGVGVTSLLTTDMCVLAGADWRGVWRLMKHNPGDMDCDGDVDFDDISPFVNAIGDAAAYYADQPACYWRNGDFDGDDDVDFDDIAPFVNQIGS
jgi:hypothetical protein